MHNGRRRNGWLGLGRPKPFPNFQESSLRIAEVRSPAVPALMSYFRVCSVPLTALLLRQAALKEQFHVADRHIETNSRLSCQRRSERSRAARGFVARSHGPRPSARRISAALREMPGVELVQFDLGDPDGLHAACVGIDHAVFRVPIGTAGSASGAWRMILKILGRWEAVNYHTSNLALASRIRCPFLVRELPHRWHVNLRSDLVHRVRPHKD